MKILQVTDTHLVEDGGTIYGIDPVARLEACVAHINAHHADASFCVLSGDLTNEGTPGAYHILKAILAELQGGWRRVVGAAVGGGVPVPAYATALSFYDGYRTANGSANMIQAQRDYFGAHTYERVDKPRGEWFHTNWTGTGGTTTSGSYNA